MAPAVWASAVISVIGGTAPVRFEVPVTATQATSPGASSSSRWSTSRWPVSSRGHSTTSAPMSSAIAIQVETLLSWSSWVHTIRSPGPRYRPSARVKASTRVVELGPKTTSPSPTPSSPPTVPRAPSISSSQAVLAAKAPPMLLAAGERMKSVMASMAESTISVPAAPSRRAQPSDNPGNRSRMLTP